MLFDISSDLNYFVLPNLTSFVLQCLLGPNATLSLSSLLGFLERSPPLENLYLSYQGGYDNTVAPRRVVTLHRMKCISITGMLLVPNDASCGLLAHLSLPSGVVVRLSVFIFGPCRDFVACAIPLHHDLIPCTKSLRKIKFLQIPDCGCAVLFSGDNGVLRISVSWQGEFEVRGAGAICSLGPLDVSGIETLVVGNCLETREHFTQTLRSLVNLCSLTLWECDNKTVLHALRQEGTSPRLRYLAIDSHARVAREGPPGNGESQEVA